MKNFVFINTEKDFKYAKKKNAKSVVIKDTFDKEIIKMAKDSGFSVWIAENCTENISVCTLSEFAGRLSREPGNVSAVTCGSFEKMLAGVGKSLEFIDGFILPAPKLSGLLWDDDFEKMTGVVGELLDIFDDYVSESYVRSLYYEAVEENIVSKYIEPVYAMAKKIGKNVCFNLGSGEIQYDFMPIFNPIRMASEGFSLAFEKSTAELDAFCSLWEEKPKNREKVLLINPVRGCRKRFVYSGKKRKVRQENPALCASFEGTYYCEKLASCGMNFVAADEYTLENSAYVVKGKVSLFGRRFENILVCKSCSFSEKGVDILKAAEASGVLVNSSELLQKLSAENLEEI